MNGGGPANRPYSSFVASNLFRSKTTQVPQLVLDNFVLQNRGSETNIIVTQPRRISAIGVSERIALERGERIGDTCGYSIKLEKKMSKKTRLLLCTTGILLRRLQCDPDLASVSHVFVDEVHERDLNTDFLLIILKDLLARRKSLKLVLMSATLNSERFQGFFHGFCCEVVSIPGRAHPVQEFRLEDILRQTGYEVKEHSDYVVKKSSSSTNRLTKSALRKMYFPKGYDTKVIHSLSIVDEAVINYELLADLLEHISLNKDEGAILVFLPGMAEIAKAIDEMRRKELFQSEQVLVYPLHSALSTSEQTAVFNVPPSGVRKIVVATNIAETSITIEDVVYVIDAGRVKESRRDEVKETPALVECWVSRASAKQRRGRAGRVRPGIAYHMYSR
jgi:HrpA-like RNA helicase